VSQTDVSSGPRLVLLGETPVGKADLSRAFSLDDKRAVVTGASSGIGRRIARVLHAAGASVAVVKQRLQALTLELPVEPLGEFALVATVLGGESVKVVNT